MGTVVDVVGGADVVVVVGFVVVVVAFTVVVVGFTVVVVLVVEVVDDVVVESGFGKLNDGSIEFFDCCSGSSLPSHT